MGALTFSKVTQNESLKAALVRRFEPLLGPVQWPEHPAAHPANGRVNERHMEPVPDHVDHTVFAAVPLELYLQTQDRKYLALGQMMADWQWSPIRNTTSRPLTHGATGPPGMGDAHPAGV